MCPAGHAGRIRATHEIPETGRSPSSYAPSCAGRRARVTPGSMVPGCRLAGAERRRARRLPGAMAATRRRLTHLPDRALGLSRRAPGATGTSQTGPLQRHLVQRLQLSSAPAGARGSRKQALLAELKPIAAPGSQSSWARAPSKRVGLDLPRRRHTLEKSNPASAGHEDGRRRLQARRILVVTPNGSRRYQEAARLDEETWRSGDAYRPVRSGDLNSAPAAGHARAATVRCLPAHRPSIALTGFPAVF